MSYELLPLTLVIVASFGFIIYLSLALLEQLSVIVPPVTRCRLNNGYLASAALYMVSMIYRYITVVFTMALPAS